MSENDRRIIIETTFSHHGRCFICRRKTTPLHKVSQKSIAFAFFKHNIIIPDGTRSCIRHLDANTGQIFDLEFTNNNIRTHPERYDPKIVKLLKSVSKLTVDCLKIEENQSKIQQKFAFEHFRNIETLNENHCQKITGWTKAQFIEFSRYIKNIRNTKNRSKGELIALYKYWLRKGIDQVSLSFFKRMQLKNK